MSRFVVSLSRVAQTLFDSIERWKFFINLHFKEPYHFVCVAFRSLSIFWNSIYWRHQTQEKKNWNIKRKEECTTHQKNPQTFQMQISLANTWFFLWSSNALRPSAAMNERPSKRNDKKMKLHHHWTNLVPVIFGRHIRNWNKDQQTRLKWWFVCQSAHKITVPKNHGRVYQSHFCDFPEKPYNRLIYEHLIFGIYIVSD